MKPATINGTFQAKNPTDGKYYEFNMSKIGWLSHAGIFHFNSRCPDYAKEKAFELFLSRFKFLNGYC
jgi:hypothetical protein